MKLVSTAYYACFELTATHEENYTDYELLIFHKIALVIRVWK